MKNVLIISANMEDNLGDKLIFESLKNYLLASNIEEVDALNFRLQFYDLNKEQIKGVPESNAGKSRFFSIKERLKNYKALYIALQVMFYIYRMPSYLKIVCPKIKRADVVIFGGGQLLMDSPKSILQALNILLYSYICRIFKKKLVILGVGIAKTFHFSLTKVAIRHLFITATSIMVRDVFSFHRAVAIYPNTRKIKFSIDLAMLEREHVFKMANNTQINRLGISTLPYYDVRYFPIHDATIYDSYKTNLANLILLWKRENEVKLIPTTTIDAETSYEISRVDTIISNTIDELYLSISTTDYFLATRMHSFIISVMQGKNSICMLWDSKVLGFLHSLVGFDYSNCIFYPEDLSNTEEIYNKLTMSNGIKLYANSYHIFRLQRWINDNVVTY
jgi:polysaccharide pyruvyl transferase WcaK-like protein